VTRTKPIALALVLLATTGAAFADERGQTAHPSDYFWQETLAGGLGAVVVGVAAPISLIEICAFMERNDLKDPDSPICHIQGGATLLFPVGVIGGAVAGVHMVGSANGVQGNLGMATLGGALGLVASIATSTPLYFGLCRPRTSRFDIRSCSPSPRPPRSSGAWGPRGGTTWTPSWPSPPQARRLGRSVCPWYRCASRGHFNLLSLQPIAQSVHDGAHV